METQEIVACESVRSKKAAGRLIWLCWLVYVGSYLGKVNYAANINQIMSFYSVEHADAGLVSTFLFFAYGVGQFVNGFLCKKYNLKWVIFASLMCSGCINLVVALTPSFAVIKYLWLINGFALSVLWPCLIRLLSESLGKKYMTKVTIMMGTTVAIGTFTIYALSALFAGFNAFKLAFMVAAVFMPVVALIWVSTVSKTVRLAKETLCEDENEISAEASNAHESVQTERTEMKVFYITIAVLAFFAIATNLVKDGLTTWIPSILKENYGLGDSFSIILSLVLPMVAVFSNFFAVALNKKINNFVAYCAMAFGLAGVIVGVVIGGLSLQIFIITLVGFAMVSFLVSSCNNTITSIVPLSMKGKANSGMLAGVLNGCCYVGSTAASYGLGFVADVWGWSAVFWLLLAVCVLVCAIAAIYFIIVRIIKKSGSR